MCRLFGMLSVEDADAAKFLLGDRCSVFAQSKASPERLQGDGWGIGFYVNGAPRLVKSEKPIYAEYERFASAVSDTHSNIVLAHVRRASNPRGLPRERLLSVENSQPFCYGNYVFAHNGTITIPDEVAESLGEWKQHIRGLNDSELYFWHLIKNMAEGASFPQAVKNFQATLSELWQKNRTRHPDKTRPYVGLNFVLGDGERFYAYCRYDKEDESARSFCFEDQRCWQMAYLVSEKSLVVASEKTNLTDDWQLMQNGQALTAEIADGKVKVAQQSI